MARVYTIQDTVSWIERIWTFVWKEYRAERVRVQVARERLSLVKLSDRELRDIGITRAQAIQEARRSYYDVPEERLDD